MAVTPVFESFSDFFRFCARGGYSPESCLRPGGRPERLARAGAFSGAEEGGFQFQAPTPSGDPGL